jgi:hypothetical protein
VFVIILNHSAGTSEATSVHTSTPLLHCGMKGAHAEFFLGRGEGGTDPEAIYNICLILKVMLQKSCKCNVTLPLINFSVKHNFSF